MTLYSTVRGDNLIFFIDNDDLISTSITITKELNCYLISYEVDNPTNIIKVPVKKLLDKEGINDDTHDRIYNILRCFTYDKFLTYEILRSEQQIYNQYTNDHYVE